MGDLAQLSVIENGSIMRAAPFVAMDAAQKFRYFGGWADKIQGLTVPTWGAAAHDYVSYEPYGVVGAILPWNGPLFAATMVLAPALAAGNCVVVKAPELAPWSVLRLGELLAEAGKLPEVRKKSRLNRIGKEKRLQGKKLRGTVKAGRGKVSFD